MCARRFLLVIFVLTLLVVAGGFAIYQWGGTVLLKQATPKGHFEASAAGGGPDYMELSTWLDRPGLRASPSLWRPDNDQPPPDAEARAAVFYVHPTTYLERDRWNAPVCDGEECGEAGRKAELFVQSQASAFSGLGDVWAPRYRQAAFGAFLLKSDDANKALDLAYADVIAAFDEFLRRNPQGPVILAGHSQGSLHLLRLLADRKDALNGRLVAAYVAGWPVGIQSDLPATGLHPCAKPAETGCVLSWQSFGEPANTALITGAWVGTRGLSGIKHVRDDMLCVDPVSGIINGRSEPRDNPGTLVPTLDLSSATLAVGQVGSRCSDGFLMVSGQVPAMGPYLLPGNNYHVYDYALYWGAIRRDAERRLAAWR
jgi:pimeloyl-ACP methyl ester carboxylesterase